MQISRRIVAVTLAVVASCWGASVMAQSMSRLPGELKLTQSGDSPGPVIFNHISHVDSDKPSCTSCHPREFRILKSDAGKRPAITHEQMEKGHFCGTCHDGKKAFAMEDCTSCHQG